MVTGKSPVKKGPRPEFNISRRPRWSYGQYPHIEWVEQFEAEHGSRPIYYGPLDRDAKSVSPRNLIYATKPLTSHMPPLRRGEAR